MEKKNQSILTKLRDDYNNYSMFLFSLHASFVHIFYRQYDANDMCFIYITFPSVNQPINDLEKKTLLMNS